MSIGGITGGIRGGAPLQSLTRLSSGKRINSAKDDPAGLAVVVELLSKNRVQNVASQNLSDGISVSSIIQGALSSASDVTTRLRELAEQSANGTLSDTQRQSLNQEYQALTQELDRIGATTTFNGVKLLSGDTPITVQGEGSDDTTALTQFNLSSSTLSLPADISTADAARVAIDAGASAQALLSQAAADNGSFASRVESQISTLQTNREQTAQAAGRIIDADYAEEVSRNVGEQIRAEGGVALQAQANVSSQVALKLL